MLTMAVMAEGTTRIAYPLNAVVETGRGAIAGAAWTPRRVDLSKLVAYRHGLDQLVREKGLELVQTPK